MKFVLFVNKIVKLLFAFGRFHLTRFFARRKLYRDLNDAAKSGLFTEDEKLSFVRRCSELQLDIKNLRRQRLKIYQTAILANLAKDSVTLEDQRRIDDIKTFLQISDVFELPLQADFDRLRLVTDIRGGSAPVLIVPNLVLSKGEIAHCSEYAKILENRVVGRHYAGGSQGLSIRIAKGVTYRTGTSRGRLITDKKVIAVSDGDFIITNKRLIFRGAVKSFDVKIEKILGINFVENGLVFTTSNREHPYAVELGSGKNLEVLRATYELVTRNLAA